MPYLKQAADMVFVVNTRLMELVDKIRKAIENHEFTVGIGPGVTADIVSTNFFAKLFDENRQETPL